MSEKIIDFDCPFCHVKIPTEYMAKKVDLVDYKKQRILVCISCAKEYTAMVSYAKEYAAAIDMADKLGCRPEEIVEMRRERQEIEKEDERLVDEEVNVMDTEAVKKAFRDKNNPQRTPLEVMRNKFFKGLEKQQQRKIIVPNLTPVARPKIIIPGV